MTAYVSLCVAYNYGVKITRSSTCTLKFATASKRAELRKVLAEYGRVVNFFISHFWNGEMPNKASLLKPIVDLPETWLSARCRKVAAREAIDMCLAEQRSAEQTGRKAKMPTHGGCSMSASSTLASLNQSAEAKEFDCWLHVYSIGNKIILDLPIRLHKHFHKWASKGKRLESYVIREDSVQFAFEIETGSKREIKTEIGLDTGIKALATLSTGEKLGTDIQGHVERVKRCEHGSAGQQRARRAMKQRMDEVAKEVVQKTDLVVVERLRAMNHGTKQTRRVCKNMRRTLGTWAYRYWLERLHMDCEENRVSFRSVNPSYTSQRCFMCGHTERANRKGSSFICLKCGRHADADTNAAQNILHRFKTASGAYGPGCKSQTPRFS